MNLPNTEVPKTMLKIRRLRTIPATALLLFVFFCALGFGEEIPRELSDEAFWKLVTDFSEPGGYFRSDNFVSNETMFQYVIPELKKTTKHDGVYMGVGPDQNFTYIVALQPAIAFIVDIRRQNLVLHLMYKALIELSEDRAEFVSRLFSRPRPAGLDGSSSAAALLEAYASALPSDELFARNLRQVI